MLKYLFPFMDADGGAGTQENNPTAEPEKEVDGGEEDGQKDADERKAGDVRSEAQRIADGIVRKRLKGLEKDDIELYKAHKDEFIKFMDSQKSEADKANEAQRKAEEALHGAAAKEAKARVNDDTSIEDAIQTVAKNNPTWVAGLELPGSGGNPAKNEEDKKTPPTMI